MTRRHILTLAVLAGVLAIALIRRNAASGKETTAPPEPQDTVYAMFYAARAGDLKSYRSAFTGPMAASLAQALSESSEKEFVRNLIDSNAAVKGIAVSTPQPPGRDDASVRVEYVYSDHDEIQIVHLARTSAGWKIAATEGDQRITIPVPYGTRVE